VLAGVSSILNFAPAVLAVPEHVDVRKVDLSIELQILAYHEQRKNGLALFPSGGVAKAGAR
jgi:redox-sensing transcriptional repressor